MERNKRATPQRSTQQELIKEMLRCKSDTNEQSRSGAVVDS